MPRFTSAVLLFLVSALGTIVSGQVVGGAMSGTVRDETGAGLPAASVSIKSVETGAERKLTTDDTGRYSAPSIAVGRYQITAAKQGFNSQLKTGIELVVAQSTVLDLTLIVGAVLQEVTVVETPSPVTVSTQETSGLVSEKQVKDLPLNGRSYDELIALNPAHRELFR